MPAGVKTLLRRMRRALRSPPPDAPAQGLSLRVMTYNVHRCIGRDGKIDVERIARVIAAAQPDVIALQDLDDRRLRVGGIDQGHLLARYLEMKFNFRSSLFVEDECYGDAILTHLPLRLVKAAALPGLADKPQLQPRGALWVAIDVGDLEMQLITTRLGLNRFERRAQLAALLGSDWLGSVAAHEPVILCGDFNAPPSSAGYRQLTASLQDAQTVNKNHRPLNTYPSSLPTFRVDHIFVSPDLAVANIEVPTTEFVRSASDHLPLLAEIRYPARPPL